MGPFREIPDARPLYESTPTQALRNYRYYNVMRRKVVMYMMRITFKANFLGFDGLRARNWYTESENFGAFINPLMRGIGRARTVSPSAIGP